MTDNGSETGIAYPTLNIKVETVDSFRFEQLKSSFQRITQNHKVYSEEEEAAVFADFSGLLQKLKRSSQLLFKHNDQSMLPTIVIKYPKSDDDGSWFVVTSYTIIVL